MSAKPQPPDPRDEIAYLKQRVAYLENQLFGLLHGLEVHDWVLKPGEARRGLIMGIEAGKLVVQWEGDTLMERVAFDGMTPVESAETLRLRRLRKLGLVA